MHICREIIELILTTIGLDVSPGTYHVAMTMALTTILTLTKSINKLMTLDISVVTSAKCHSY